MPRPRSPERVRKTFAFRLDLALAASDMTARQVAAKVGVHETQLSKWRAGKFIPHGHRLVALAKVLDVPVDWLLGVD